MPSVPTRSVRTAADLVIEASADAMVDTVFRIRKRFRRYKRWLLNSNPYKHVIITLGDPAHHLDAPQMAEYVACSAPLHLMDGWTYLTRAFDSLVHGDSETAAHLGYYAELRAGMSILACEGIGVFNRQHVAVTVNYETVDWRNGGTHAAGWPLLEAWRDEGTRVQRLLDSITVESREVRDWLTVAGSVPRVASVVGARWLDAWSLELSLLEGDRDFRNDRSYRPTRMLVQDIPKLSVAKDIIEPLLGAWNAFQPSGRDKEAQVDIRLLARALHLVYNKEATASGGSWEGYVNRLSGTASPPLLQILRDYRPKADDELFAAADDGTRPPKTQSLLARAALLLRIASGRCRLLLESASVHMSDLEFWMLPLGADYGLWENQIDLLSLWADVEEALQEIDQENNNDMTVRLFRTTFSKFPALTEFCRVPVWLLGD